MLRAWRFKVSRSFLIKAPLLAACISMMPLTCVVPLTFMVPPSYAKEEISAPGIEPPPTAIMDKPEAISPTSVTNPLPKDPEEEKAKLEAEAKAKAEADAKAAAEAKAAAKPEPPKKPTPLPAPKGMPQAMKLFNAHQYAQAQKQFESFINTGVADEATHYQLALCLYYQRKYTACLKQFDWVGKYGKATPALQTRSQSISGLLRKLMAGICPGNCLRVNDPRWQPTPGFGGGLGIRFPTSDGYVAFSQNHTGHIIQTVNGIVQDVGPCPTCGGAGAMTPLRDGAPLPNQ